MGRSSWLIRASGDATVPPDLSLHSALSAFDREHGARFTCFGGYAVPACYEAGVLQGHLHTRAAASLFDLSHMGQLLILPRDGCRVRDIVLELETSMPLDVLGMKAGQQRYGFMTTAGHRQRELTSARLLNLQRHSLIQSLAAWMDSC
jgi:aminomethyltransferase